MRISNLSELSTFCEDFLKQNPKGGIFALVGELGAGKTTFVRTLIEKISQLDGKKSPRVTSPTYVYHQRYDFSRPVEHFDLYRLEKATEDDLMSIGYYEAYDRARNSLGFLFVEWPEKSAQVDFLRLTHTLSFKIESETERIIEFH